MLCAVLLPACDSSISGSGTEAMVTDSAGVRITTVVGGFSGLPQWGVGDEWAMPLAADDILSDATIVAFLMDGRVLVGDRDQGVIHRFTRAGDYESRFGGWGAASEPMQELAGISMTSGDTAFVFDRGSRSVSALDESAQVIAQIPVQLVAGDEPVGASQFWAASPQNFLLTTGGSLDTPSQLFEMNARWMGGRLVAELPPVRSFDVGAERAVVVPEPGDQLVVRNWDGVVTDVVRFRTRWRHEIVEIAEARVDAHTGEVWVQLGGADDPANSTDWLILGSRLTPVAQAARSGNPRLRAIRDRRGVLEHDNGGPVLEVVPIRTWPDFESY